MSISESEFNLLNPTKENLVVNHRCIIELSCRMLLLLSLSPRLHGEDDSKTVLVITCHGTHQSLWADVGDGTGRWTTLIPTKLARMASEKWLHTTTLLSPLWLQRWPHLRMSCAANEICRYQRCGHRL